MEKEKIIKLIAGMIRDEYRKHNNLTDEWPEIAAIKLYSHIDYWKQRCLMAEKWLKESPCDPDITSDQIKAWNAYLKFIELAGNNH